MPRVLNREEYTVAVCVQVGRGWGGGMSECVSDSTVAEDGGEYGKGEGRWLRVTRVKDFAGV